MKILVVVTVEFQLNGITSVVMNYYRNMDKTGMQIDFVVINEIEETYKEELNLNGSVIYHIPRKENIFLYQKRLYRVLKEKEYDIVHIHGNSAMMTIDILPAVWAKTRVRIVHVHNTTCSNVKLHKLLQPLFKKCYTHGFACGETAGKWLFGKEPFIILKNGIDLKKYFYDEAVRKNYRKSIEAGEKTVIGHIANFVEQKNHIFLLELYGELLIQDRNYLLLLIGEGELMNKIKKKAEELCIEDSVLFLGKVRDVPNYLQAMDILVLPSLYEGLPVALVEGQAAGLPGLVSDKITREANFTEELRYISIDKPQIWVDELRAISRQIKEENRKERCELYQKRIMKRGYDITKNSDVMKELYSQFLAQSTWSD